MSSDIPSSLRIAVIGGGEAAKKALTSLKDTNVVTIAAVFCEKEELIDIIDPKIRLASVHEIMERPDIELVYVATPTGSHVQIALEAIGAGKNVLIEKPLAVSAQNAKSLMEQESSFNGVIAVNFKKRFGIGVTELIHSDIIKNPDTCATYIWCNPLPFTAWRFDTAVSGGGVLMDLGSHVFDLFEYLFGPIDSVLAQLKWLKGREDIDDEAIVEMNFKSGNTAHAEFSWRSGKVFQQISMKNELEQVVIERVNGPDDIIRQSKHGKIIERPIKQKFEYVNMFENLRRYVRLGMGTIPTLNDGFRNLIIIDAVRQSALNNKIVRIP